MDALDGSHLESRRAVPRSTSSSRGGADSRMRFSPKARDRRLQSQTAPCRLRPPPRTSHARSCSVAFRAPEGARDGPSCGAPNARRVAQHVHHRGPAKAADADHVRGHRFQEYVAARRPRARSVRRGGFFGARIGPHRGLSRPRVLATLSAGSAFFPCCLQFSLLASAGRRHRWSPDRTASRRTL